MNSNLKGILLVSAFLMFAGAFCLVFLNESDNSYGKFGGEETTIDGFKYGLSPHEDGTWKIVFISVMDVTKTTLEIPSEITVGSDKKAVGHLGDSVCDDSFGSVTRVTVPDTVRYIGKLAFCEVANMVEYQGPIDADYVRDATEGSFKGLDKLTKFVLTPGKTGRGLDYENNTGKMPPWTKKSGFTIEVKEGVKYIGNFTFGYNNKDGVTLPSSLESVGKYAINRMQINDDLYGYFYEGNINMFGVKCWASDVDVNIQSTYTVWGQTYTVKVIGSFDEGVVNKVTLPNTVEIIDDYAFQNATCDSINLSDLTNLKEINERAFAYLELKQDTTLKIPASVEKIGENAFGLTTYSSINVDVDSKNKFFKKEGNLLLSKDGKRLLNAIGKCVIVPESVEEIDYGAILFPGYLDGYNMEPTTLLIFETTSMPNTTAGEDFKLFVSQVKEHIRYVFAFDLDSTINTEGFDVSIIKANSNGKIKFSVSDDLKVSAEGVGNSGYKFSKWSNESTDNPIIIESNSTLSAEFEDAPNDDNNEDAPKNGNNMVIIVVVVVVAIAAIVGVLYFMGLGPFKK